MFDMYKFRYSKSLNTSDFLGIIEGRMMIQEFNDKIIIDKETFEKFMRDVVSIVETLEILADEDMVNQIRESERDIESGNVYRVKSVKELEMAIFS